MSTEVNLEIAQLLIKKDIDIKSRRKYKVEEGSITVLVDSITSAIGGFFKTYNAPTIADVIMHLYEKHGIWIVVDYYNDGDDDIWFYNYKTKDKESMDEGYNSPTQAYEAAIEYVLRNLI